MISIRYAPAKPVNRPAPISSPPRAASELRDSLVIPAATTAPPPRPASAAHASTNLGRGGEADRRHVGRACARAGEEARRAAPGEAPLLISTYSSLVRPAGQQRQREGPVRSLAWPARCARPV